MIKNSLAVAVVVASLLNTGVARTIPSVGSTTLRSANPILHLSHAQSAAIVKAYRLGGLVFAAIILQESSACAIKHGKLDPKAFGCGQLHSDTADGIYGSHIPERVLMTENNLNLEIAYQHLRRCVAAVGWSGAVTCYKWGVTASHKFTHWFLTHSPYLKMIRQREHELESLPVSED